MMEKQDDNAWTSQALSGSDKIEEASSIPDITKPISLLYPSSDKAIKQPAFASEDHGESKQSKKINSRQQKIKRQKIEETNFTVFGKIKYKKSKKTANQKNADTIEKRRKTGREKQLNEKARDTAISRNAVLTSKLDADITRVRIERSAVQGNKRVQTVQKRIKSEESEITDLSRQVTSGAYTPSITEKIKQEVNKINKFTDEELKIIAQAAQQENHAYPKVAISGDKAARALQEQSLREGTKNHPTPIPMNPEMNKQKDSKAVTER